MKKRYFAITERFTKLYYLTESKNKKFKELFPNFDSHPSDEEHNKALAWVEANGKFLGDCDSCAYSY